MHLFEATYRSLGLFLFAYSLWLLPYGAMLYSTEGLLSDYRLNGLPVWSSLFAAVGSSSAVTIGLLALAICGLLAALNKRSSLLMLVALLLYVSFQNRNVLTLNPGTDLIGFLIAFFALSFLALRSVPHTAATDELRLPTILYEGTWLMLGLAFSASGIARLRGEAWFAGTGVGDIFSVMPVRDNELSRALQAAVIEAPESLLIVLTFIVSATFILALPLSLIRNTRPYLLVVLASFYAIVLVISDMTQIVLPLFIVFLLLSDVLCAHGTPRILRSICRGLARTFSRKLPRRLHI